MTGRHRLDGAGQMVDPPHDLELFLDENVLVLLPVGLRPDEESGAAAIAIGGLHNEIRAELRLAGELQKLAVTLCFTERIGCALDPRFIAELGGDDLGIDPFPELRRWQRNLEAKLSGELFGLLIEHHEKQETRPALSDA